LLGTSLAMRRLFAKARRIAQSSASVLIEGETGTGKSVLARVIHDASPRSHGPFVVVDCGSIPPTLIESVLFGHDKGAFTGAHAARPGAFETAHGGTVFLDEVGELPLELQPKLLRLLETREIQRIGATAPSVLEVRILAATNRDLREMVHRRKCRADLYYRLSVVTLQIPPLRERREDIARLVAQFYGQFSDGGAPPDAMVRRFEQIDWPGNVRELKNAVERAVLLGDIDEPCDPDPPALPGGHPPAAADAFDPTLSFRDAKEQAITRWERWYVAQLMRYANGNLSKAARIADSDRSYLRKLVKKHLRVKPPL
jgi:transcriptional regulator with GAF, ATPase, and Fis domain